MKYFIPDNAKPGHMHPVPKPSADHGRCIHEIYGHEHGRHEFCDHDGIRGFPDHSAHEGRKYGFYIHGNEVKPSKYDKEHFDAFRDSNAVHIQEDMKSSDIVDGYGNTRFRVTMFGVDALDDEDRPVKRYFVDVVNFMYGPEPERVCLLPNENPGFEKYHQALDCYRECVDDYSRLVAAECRDFKDIKTFGHNGNYMDTCPECCLNCKFCRRVETPGTHVFGETGEFECIHPKNFRQPVLDEFRYGGRYYNHTFHSRVDLHPRVDMTGVCDYFERRLQKMKLVPGDDILEIVNERVDRVNRKLIQKIDAGFAGGEYDMFRLGQKIDSAQSSVISAVVQTGNGLSGQADANAGAAKSNFARVEQMISDLSSRQQKIDESALHERFDALQAQVSSVQQTAENCDLYGYVICDKLNNKFEPMAKLIMERQSAISSVVCALCADTACMHVDIKDVMNSIDILKRRSIDIMHDTGKIWDKVKDLDSSSLCVAVDVTQLAAQLNQTVMGLENVQNRLEENQNIVNSLKTSVIHGFSTVNNNVGLLSSDITLKLADIGADITEMQEEFIDIGQKIADNTDALTEGCDKIAAAIRALSSSGEAVGGSELQEIRQKLAAVQTSTINIQNQVNTFGDELKQEITTAVTDTIENTMILEGNRDVEDYDNSGDISKEESDRYNGTLDGGGA